MEHKWLKNFDADGNWTKPERILHIGGEVHDLDEYAKKHGIDLPDSKNKKTKVNSNEDIQRQDDEGIDPES
tara:strand:- start:313 stop:525 length:213 start_codon:yes stop_codon:yes gene_type:complete